MKIVDSAHNDTFKHLKKLASSSKHRRNANETLLSGVHLCQNYLQQGGRPIEYVYTTSAVDNPEANKIIAACERMSIPAVLISEAKLRAISGVDNGIGIIFVVTIPKLISPEKITTNTLLLDGIQDPSNLGAILRTSAAAGIKEIFSSNDSTSAWSPKALRTAMGAHTALNIYENCDLEQLIGSSSIPVLATSLDAKESLYQQNLTSSVAWLFGSEGSGVSDKLLSMDVRKIIIPQDNAVESLNVAASVAICLFEQVRQQSVVK